MTSTSDLPPIAVLPGRGTVTAMAGALVVAPASPSRAQLLAIAAAAAEAGSVPGAAVGTMLEGVVRDVPGLGVAVAAHRSWLVTTGEGVRVSTDHVGHRMTAVGPVSQTIRGATRISIGGGGAPGHLITAAPTSHGTRSGSGVVIEVEAALGTGAAAVEGLRCPCGAFLHPLSVVCRGCQQLILTDRVIVREPGVPVGRIVLDDGRALALSGAVVIGREPEAVATERGMAALVLSDSQRSVSRAHAVISVDGWDVVLEDRRSANGTSVRPASSGEWTVLVPGSSVRILPGTDVMLGRRAFRLV